MAAQYRYIDSANTYHRYMLVFNADGTGEFKEQNFANLSWSTAVSTTFTFTYADGLVVIDFADGTIAVDGSYDVTADQVLDVFTKDGYISFTVYE